jgi:carotenoid cleavage dioxygenase
LGGPVSLHDTAITEKWIVLLDLPVLFDLELAGTGASFPYRWFDDHPARVGLLPRDGESTDVVWHDIDPCYVFHTVNAFDVGDGTGVVLDVVRHPSIFRTNLMGPAEGPPTLERWHIDGHGSPVKEERLDDRGQEFPRIDERHLGRPYRVGFSVAARRTDDIVGTESGLIRHDVQANTSEVRHFRSGATIGEAVFVPRSSTAREGDGWVMTLVHQAGTDTSDLYILNAGDICGEPQAIVQLPQRVPTGFHGNWVPDPA